MPALFLIALIASLAEPEIRPGHAVNGTITQYDAVRTLVRGDPPATESMHHVSYRLVPRTNRRYTIDLRSLEFDAYLIVENSDGMAVAENDDGGYWTDSRVIFDGVEGETYTLIAGCLQEVYGDFTLRASMGTPDLLEISRKHHEDIRQGRQALNHCRRNFGPDHPNTIACLNKLGLFLVERGEAAEARELFEEALGACMDRYGQMHKDTARALSNLGAAMYRQGETGNALTLMEMALDICEKTLGHDHARTYGALKSLSNTCFEQGMYGRAKPLYEKLYDIQSGLLDHDHPETARLFNNLGVVYYHAGEGRASEYFLSKALSIEKGCSAFILHHLARTLLGLEKLQRAREACERALALFEEERGEDDIETLYCLDTLATILMEMGELEAADRLFERTLRLARKKLGNLDPLVAALLHDQARLMKIRGEWREAIILLEEALSIQEKAPGNGGEAAARTLVALGDMNAILKKRRQAMYCFDRALKMRREIHGSIHPLTAEALSYLSFLYLDMGRHQRALACSEQALEINGATLGELHRTTIKSLYNMAVLHERLDHLEASIGYYEEMLARSKAAHMRENIFCATAAHHLGELLASGGRKGEAQLLMEEALKTRRVHLGDDHPRTRESLKALVGILQQLDRTDEARRWIVEFRAYGEEFEVDE